MVIFPEGTYVRDAVGSGKNRLIRMILGIQSELKERIPFIPVGIRYGERSGWRRRVDIRMGPPLCRRRTGGLVVNPPSHGRDQPFIQAAPYSKRNVMNPETRVRSQNLDTSKSEPN